MFEVRDISEIRRNYITQWLNTGTTPLSDVKIFNKLQKKKTILV